MATPPPLHPPAPTPARPATRRSACAPRRNRPRRAAGFAFFFCLFAGYFMLRPVRETMGIAGGA